MAPRAMRICPGAPKQGGQVAFHFSPEDLFTGAWKAVNLREAKDLLAPLRAPKRPAWDRSFDAASRRHFLHTI
jgi:hypothetical protein